MSADSPLEQRLAARLDDWARAGLLRTLRPPAGIDLSSNDYLHLSRHPRLVDAFVAAAMREGVGSTGSRLLRGERDTFAAIEQRFADFKGTARALYFSSGYQANLAVLTALTEPVDVIFSDALNHASLIDGARLSRAGRVIVPHNDVARLDELLAETPCAGLRFVVVESVFSMDGDLAPLRDIAAVCAAHQATLIVDEAHAVGVYGATGSGLIEALGLDATTCMSINTAGKALGVAGAFVAGPALLIEYLVQRGRPFVFSTAPPPAVADAIGASLDLLAAEPERRARVHQLAAHLRAALRHHGIAVADDGSQIIPVTIGDNDTAVRVAARLNADGFDVRAIRPPTVPEGTARLRVSVNAGLDEATLTRFAAAVAAAFQEVGFCSAVSS